VNSLPCGETRAHLSVNTDCYCATKLSGGEDILAKALSLEILCHVAVGLHFLRVDNSVHGLSRQEAVARLGRCGREQPADLPDWHQDGTVWIRASESLLHLSVFLQPADLEEQIQVRVKSWSSSGLPSLFE